MTVFIVFEDNGGPYGEVLDNIFFNEEDAKEYISQMRYPLDFRIETKVLR